MLINSVDATNDANRYTKPLPNKDPKFCCQYAKTIWIMAASKQMQPLSVKIYNKLSGGMASHPVHCPSFIPVLVYLSIPFTLLVISPFSFPPIIFFPSIPCPIPKSSYRVLGSAIGSLIGVQGTAPTIAWMLFGAFWAQKSHLETTVKNSQMRLPVSFPGSKEGKCYPLPMPYGHPWLTNRSFFISYFLSTSWAILTWMPSGGSFVNLYECRRFIALLLLLHCM